MLSDANMIQFGPFNLDVLPCASQLGQSRKRASPALHPPIRYSMVFVKEAEGNWNGNRGTVLKMTRKAEVQEDKKHVYLTLQSNTLTSPLIPTPKCSHVTQ